MIGYITPNTTITIYKGVPLHPDMKDAIYFGSESAKAAWFGQFFHQQFTMQYYQRENRNFCRLEGNAEDFDKCNYMSFKNASYSEKTFYAYIIEVNYINNNVFEIEYKIDPLTTYSENYRLRECFIERQHSETDNVGDNLVEEPISVTDYVVLDRKTMGSVTYVYAVADSLGYDPDEQQNN